MSAHVADDLELFVLGALDARERERVSAHLAACGQCRAEADALGSLVEMLADTLPPRDPPRELRERILATARAERVRTPRARPAWVPLAPWLASGALAAAVIALAALNVDAAVRQRALESELARTQEIAHRVSQGGRTWAMHGVDPWKGAGAMLYAPAGAPAYVVFRDLPPPPDGHVYAIWLVDAEGRWVRGTSFDQVSRIQLVDVGVPVEGFEQCAVTLESRREGKREGRIVMQSRIYTP